MIRRVSLGDIRRWLPARKPDSHKGDFGHVLIVAGSRGMSGAAVLAGRAALRAGAGLVTLAAPESIQAVVSGMLAEAMTLGLPETGAGSVSPEASARLQAAHRERSFAVLALGPGLGTHPDTARAVVAVLGSLRLPAVVDADALNNLAGQPRESVRELLSRRGAPCVFTPHPGELARLLRVEVSEIQADRPASARRLAVDLGVACLLKGHDTAVSDGRREAVNPTGNAGLAKGGTGDALTGVVAALWAQRIGSGAEAGSGFEAAAMGAYLHGLAADIAVKDKTVYSLLASDVIEALPSALRRLR